MVDAPAVFSGRILPRGVFLLLLHIHRQLVLPCAALCVRVLRYATSLHRKRSAGVIRVLCTNHPLNWTLYYTGNQNSAGAHVLIDKEEHANIVSLIGAHPKTRTITNAELRSGVTIPMIPATLGEYKEYHDWQDLVPITTDIMTDAKW